MEFLLKGFARLDFICTAHAQGNAVFRRRLHDQQDRDRLAGQGVHHPPRNTHPAPQTTALHGDRSHIVQVRYSPHHVGSLRTGMHQRPRLRRIVGVSDFARNLLSRQWCQGLGGNDLGTEISQLHGLVVTDLIKAVRVADNAWISSEKPIHIFPDLTQTSPGRSCNRRR